MAVRPIRVILAGCALLLVLIQYPLWFGRGGWLRVWELEEQLQRQQSVNDELRARNAALAAEVADLKAGTEAAGERARRELGMIGRDEVFVQLGDGSQQSVMPQPSSAVPPSPPTRP